MKITRIYRHRDNMGTPFDGHGIVEFSDGFLCVWTANLNGSVMINSILDNRPIKNLKREGLVQQWVRDENHD